MTNRNIQMTQGSYRNRPGIRGGARGRGAGEGVWRGGAGTELGVLTTVRGVLQSTCPQLLMDMV